uniref:Uncharacterized protein n=1 Tax=Geospiza parvula TaxID=87175 RepID=A0A8C3NJM0_GEOPR
QQETAGTQEPRQSQDCDDPDVFKAVDAALKKYNEDEATGNQFALYVVMEAKRTAGPDPHFYVKYRILESTCATEENKHWQHCHYKVSAEAPYVIWFVSFSDVSKIKLTEAPCLGCFHPISSDGSEVSEILKKAIQKFNKHSDEPALFKLAEIKEAKRQVVAGWNYVIRYKIEETNCTKDQFQDLTPECKITSRGPLSTLNLLFLRSETCCSLSVEETVVAAICPGCPRTIPTDSPELKELLKVSTEKYNSESDDDFYYKGGEIQSATVQVGIFHRDEEQILHYYWPELNASLSCDAQIHVIPWQDKIYPQVNCSEEHQVVRFFFITHPIKQSGEVLPVGCSSAFSVKLWSIKPHQIPQIATHTRFKS